MVIYVCNYWIQHARLNQTYRWKNKKESDDDGSKPKGTRDQCKTEFEIKFKLKSRNALEVEKKSSRIVSVLTIKCTGISVSKEDNMAADENLAAADNGSPGEKKNYLSDFFFLWL